jgi:hypothetical protein
MLKLLFTNSQLSIQDLFMCTQASERRFKFAVGDKAEFLTLFNWTQPDVIKDKKVEISKSRALPEFYSLVVRYVPADVNSETARVENMKTIPTAVNLSTINYKHRQRPSYVIRFSVRNFEQYHKALQLGRVAIGQHYLPLTTVLTVSPSPP